MEKVKWNHVVVGAAFLGVGFLIFLTRNTLAEVFLRADFYYPKPSDFTKAQLFAYLGAGAFLVGFYKTVKAFWH